MTQNPLAIGVVVLLIPVILIAFEGYGRWRAPRR